MKKIYCIVPQLILFLVKEQIGKWLVIVWLSMWFAIQWLQIEGKYIPDVYHTILHILILCALISTIVYSINYKKRKSNILYRE